MNFEEVLRKIVLDALDERLRPFEERLSRLQFNAPATGDPGDLLALPDCAKESGYAPNTLRKAIRAGKLAAVKGPKEWRVKRGDLLAWVAKRPAYALSSLDVASKADRLLARR